MIFLSVNTSHSVTSSPGDYIPPSDFAGSFSSLLSNRWLCSTTIERVLALYSDPKYRVVDHTFIAIDDLATLANKQMVKIKPSHQNIILPILWQDHWTVVLFNFNNGQVEVYDSLPDENTNVKIREIINEFGRYLKKHERLIHMHWQIMFKVLSFSIIDQGSQNAHQTLMSPRILPNKTILMIAGSTC